MWNGKNKAVTFSYDDGIEQDKRLVDIFNTYGLKCTFNLNSGIMNEKGNWVTQEGLKLMMMCCAWVVLLPVQKRSLTARNCSAARTGSVSHIKDSTSE